MKSGNDLEVIFDDCVERMARGESLESCLQRYRAHAAELRDLLLTAQALSALAGPPPPPSTLMASGRQAFLRAAAQPVQRPAAVTPPTTRAPAAPNRRALPWGWLRGAQPVGRPGLIALALLMILAFTTAFTTLSISALPGDLFYPPKVTAESLDVSVRTMMNPDLKDELEFGFDTRRANEARLAMDLGRTTPVTLNGVVIFADEKSLTLDTDIRISLPPGLFATHNPNLRPGALVTVMGHTDPAANTIWADQIIVTPPPPGTTPEARVRPTATSTMKPPSPTRRQPVVPVRPTRRPTTRPTRVARPTATPILPLTIVPSVTVIPTDVATATVVATTVFLTPTATSTVGEITPTATVEDLTPTPVDSTPTASPTPDELTPTPTDVVPATPTATEEPPTDTPVPPTDTPVPPTDTPVPPPTDTPVPPTDTPVPPPTDTPVPLSSNMTGATTVAGTRVTFPTRIDPWCTPRHLARWFILAFRYAP